MIRAPKAAALLAAIIVVLCLAVPAVAAAEEEGTTAEAAKVSLAEWEAKLSSKQVKSVTVNTYTHALKTTLRNGSEVVAKFPKKDEKPYVAKIRAAHVPLTVLSGKAARKESKKKPHKHKIRYIVGGVLIVIIVIGGTVFLLRRRRVHD
jgi:ATP-dependent Zn protease